MPFSQNDAWFARLERSQFRSALRNMPNAPIFVRASGSFLWDADGCDWVDFVCGHSSLNFGHAYPALIETAMAQLAELAHDSAGNNIRTIELAELLLQRLAAECPYKVVFNSSGARAIEAAWKAAVSIRPGKILTLAPSLHGRTIASAALSETNRSSLSGLFDCQAEVWPKEHYPYCAKCHWNLQYPSCEVRCVDGILRHLRDTATEISCVLLEPALTARGYIFPPDEFFLEIRRLTAELGILLIADEIQTGLGRCAPFALSRQQGWLPDLLVFGKSLGGGLFPISATLGRQELLDSLPYGVESETFSGMPAASAVALHVLRLLEDGKLFESGCSSAARIREHLKKHFSQVQVPVQIESTMASCVVEFFRARDAIQSSRVQACKFAESCHKHRVRVQLTGPEATRVVLLPALTLTEAELKVALERLGLAVHSAFL